MAGYRPSRDRGRIFRATVHSQLRPALRAVGRSTPYHFDVSLQLNVLPDGRPAVSDRALLMATGTTTSTAGSQTHFDD